MLSWDEFETKENKVSPATIQKEQELTSSEPVSEPFRTDRGSRIRTTRK